MKRIAGIRLWIWGVGAVTVYCLSVALMRIMPANEAKERPYKESVKEETAKQRTERIARECFEVMREVRRYCILHPEIAIPMNLPYGDEAELKKSEDARNATISKLHEKRREFESRLEKAEISHSEGYLCALRNAWSETIRREVYEKDPRSIVDYEFEDAIELGRSVTKL